jgi:hypothetical protein
MSKTSDQPGNLVLIIPILHFGFVSDFELRISSSLRPSFAFRISHFPAVHREGGFLACGKA